MASKETKSRPAPRSREKIGCDVESLGAYLESLAVVAETAQGIAAGGEDREDFDRLMALAVAVETMSRTAMHRANRYGCELQGLTYGAHDDED